MSFVAKIVEVRYLRAVIEGWELEMGGERLYAANYMGLETSGARELLEVH